MSDNREQSSAAAADRAAASAARPQQLFPIWTQIIIYIEARAIFYNRDWRMHEPVAVMFCDRAYQRETAARWIMGSSQIHAFTSDAETCEVMQMEKGEDMQMRLGNVPIVGWLKV